MNTGTMTQARTKSSILGLPDERLVSCSLFCLLPIVLVNGTAGGPTGK